MSNTVYSGYISDCLEAQMSPKFKFFVNLLTYLIRVFKLKTETVAYILYSGFNYIGTYVLYPESTVYQLLLATLHRYEIVLSFKSWSYWLKIQVHFWYHRISFCIYVLWILRAVHKRRRQLGGGRVKICSNLPKNSTKKLPTWGRGLSKIGGKLPTLFMDGPLRASWSFFC